jgi:uncharacterized membrane protein
VTVASHILGWIAGAFLVAFAAVGLWMAAPVAWTSFRAPTEAERDAFTARRSRIPFVPWFGLGLLGLATAAVAMLLR